MTNTVKKALIILPSVLVLVMVFLYYFTNSGNPSVANNPLTLISTIPPLLGLIYNSRPSAKVKYLVYISSAVVVLLNFLMTGSIDALSILVFGLLVVGVSL